MFEYIPGILYLHKSTCLMNRIVILIFLPVYNNKHFYLFYFRFSNFMDCLDECVKNCLNQKINQII